MVNYMKEVANVGSTFPQPIGHCLILSSSVVNSQSMSETFSQWHTRTWLAQDELHGESSPLSNRKKSLKVPTSMLRLSGNTVKESKRNSRMFAKMFSLSSIPP